MQPFDTSHLPSPEPHYPSSTSSSSSSSSPLPLSSLGVSTVLSTPALDLELTPNSFILDNPALDAPGNFFPDLGQPSSTSQLHPGLSLGGAAKKGKKRGRPPANSPHGSQGEDDDEETVIKRQRNNIAAKKYRQKKIDRIEELEAEVDGVKKERDDLRIKLARQEAETAALREMLKMATGGR